VEDTEVGDVQGAPLWVPTEPLAQQAVEELGPPQLYDPQTGRAESPPTEPPDEADEPAAPDDADPEEPAETPVHEAADIPRPERLEDGSYAVTFEFLEDFQYLPSDIRDEFGEDIGDYVIEIPDEVRAIAGKTITIEGFMMPTEVDDDQNVRRLVLMRELPGCCFAVMPAINGWIDVTVSTEAELEYVPYMIVEATGTFDVGEEIRSDVVVSLFRLRDAKVQEVE
jgi:hypothetical protein